MSEQRWIIVRNWDRFQHYKDRDPPWIKDYTEQLDDPAYLELTGVQRAVLHGIRLKYAASRRQVLDSTALISRQLNVRVTRETLDALNHAGFIEYSASKPLADCKQDASPRATREEAEAERTPQPTPEAPEPKADRPTPNDVRDSAFRAYRAHGGNLKLEKERNALARGVTSLLTAGHAADIIVAAAGDLGRDQAFPGYLKQRVEQIVANGGVCKNRGLDRSKLTVPELQACGCKGDSGCAAWAEALGAKT